MKSKPVIALAGNPNAGKTTIFNMLTGSRQKVGNYPGVTVERKEGTLTIGGTDIQVVDLPGTYSLTAYSLEEQIARDFILNEKPDVVVDVIDSSNLERNLYLALQIMELQIPMVLAFNMSDMAKSRGMEFDIGMLEKRLGVRIVQLEGHRQIGHKDLLEAIDEALSQKPIPPVPEIHYAADVEQSLAKIQERLAAAQPEESAAMIRWTAVKLLENDPHVMARVQDVDVRLVAQDEQKRINKIVGESPEMLIADGRYGYISGVCHQALKITAEARHNASDKIDSVLIHRFWGLPIFLGLMYVVFWLTFTVGGPPMEWIEAGFEWLSEGVTGLLPEGILQSLIVDGIIGGVGGVIVFLPNILLLFFAISLLEDSGYMARVAFIMDRLMNKIGLHGKSFIPMLTGFGCSIPAIMSTRTLENERDRLTTMMVVPLMSCGARLPIYALIIPAFFPQVWQAPVLWLIYVTGIALAIVCAKVLRMTILKGDNVPFVMELPPYRMPTLKGALFHMWERAGLYLKKAGTIILAVSVVLWAMTSFPELGDVDDSLSEEEQQAEMLAYTVAGRIGHAIEPIIRPLGFDWQIGTSMIGAFAAKEVFVAQMGIVYSLGETDEESEPLREKLAGKYSPLIGLCIMLFMLISAPCMATIAVTKRESNSWKWALFQLAGLTILAYGITLLVYQIGTALGF